MGGRRGGGILELMVGGGGEIGALPLASLFVTAGEVCNEKGNTEGGGKGKLRIWKRRISAYCCAYYACKKRWFLPLLFAALPWEFIKHFQEDFRIVVFPPIIFRNVCFLWTRSCLPNKIPMLIFL